MNDAVSVVNAVISSIIGGLCIYILKRMVDETDWIKKFMMDKFDRIEQRLNAQEKSLIEVKFTVEKIRDDKSTELSEIRKEVNAQGRVVEVSEQRSKRMSEEIERHQNLLASIIKYMKKVNDILGKTNGTTPDQ